jgi:TorA maturation chaperone TorD
VLQKIKQFRKDFYSALYHCQQTEGDAPEFFTLENDEFLIQKAKSDDEERVYRGHFKNREQYFLIKSTFDPNREIETLSYFKTDEDYSNLIFLGQEKLQAAPWLKDDDMENIGVNIVDGKLNIDY